MRAGGWGGCVGLSGRTGRGGSLRGRVGSRLGWRFAFCFTRWMDGWTGRQAQGVVVFSVLCLPALPHWDVWERAILPGWLSAAFAVGERWLCRLQRVSVWSKLSVSKDVKVKGGYSTSVMMRVLSSFMRKGSTFRNYSRVMAVPRGVVLS